MGIYNFFKLLENILFFQTLLKGCNTNIFHYQTVLLMPSAWYFLLLSIVLVTTCNESVTYKVKYDTSRVYIYLNNSDIIATILDTKHFNSCTIH